MNNRCSLRQLEVCQTPYRLVILALNHAITEMPPQVMSRAWQTKSIKTLCPEKSVRCTRPQVIYWRTLLVAEVCCVKHDIRLHILTLNRASTDMPPQFMSKAWQAESIKTALCLEKSVEGRSLKVIEQSMLVAAAWGLSNAISPCDISLESCEHWHATTSYVTSLTN